MSTLAESWRIRIKLDINKSRSQQHSLKPYSNIVLFFVTLSNNSQHVSSSQDRDFTARSLGRRICHSAFTCEARRVRDLETGQSMVFGRNLGISLPITDHTTRTNFTTTEKAAYLDAALCLTTAEPTIGLGDSATLWQEMQYAHIGQVTWIHNVVRRAPVPSHDDLQILFFV